MKGQTTLNNNSKVDQVHIEPGVYCLFFVLAGTHINFALMWAVGVGGTSYVIARGIGKYVATTLGAHLGHASPLVKKWMGISLFPQAGIAVGLVFIVDSIPEFAPFAKHVIAKIFGQNPELLEQIFKAKKAAGVHEILQSGDVNEVNVYLDT
ncbi:hypothetical protein ACFL6U_08515 [Planctomycetota bacterium]